MGIEGIIAVIGFALAAYAILPRWRQLDLAFRFRWFDGLLATVGILGLFYLQFHPVFAKFGWTPHWGLMTRWNVTTAMAASALVTVIGVLLFFHMKTMALHPYRVGRFARLADELIQAKEYAALFTLLDRYTQRLWQISQGQNGLSRLRAWMMKGRHGWDHERGMPDMSLLVMEMGDELAKPAEQRKPIKQVGPIRDAVMPKLARLIPKQLTKQNEAKAVLARIFTSDEIMSAFVMMRPEVLVPILRRREKHYEFLDELLRHLLRAPGSALYRQVAGTQGIGMRRTYRIEPEGGLLDVLIGDASFAEEHSLWQPIAVEALAMFTELRRNPAGDPYNVTYDQRFREEGRWNMPFFIVVQYFDIMVSKAMEQGVAHNMWLSYFTSFVEAAIENYKPVGPDYEPEREFPTRYSYLLYQMFSVTRDWVRLTREYPRKAETPVLEEVRAGHGDEYVPTAAARTLARSLRHVLKAGALEPTFKHYLANVVFSLYFDLRQHGPRDYADLLLYFLTHDGYGGRDVEYGRALAEALGSADTFFVMQYRELEEAIGRYNNDA